MPREIADYSARNDLALALYPSAEAQAGAIADDIAYDAHDIDDGLRAHMFTVDDLAELPLVADLLAGSTPATHTLRRCGGHTKWCAG